MNMTNFTDDFLFQEKYEAEELKYKVEIDELAQQDDLFLEMSSFANFPSVCNSNLMSLEAQKSYMYTESENRQNLMHQAYLKGNYKVNQDQGYCGVQSSNTGDTKRLNLNSCYAQVDEDFKEKTTCNFDLILNQQQLCKNSNCADNIGDLSKQTNCKVQEIINKIKLNSKENSLKEESSTSDKDEEEKDQLIDICKEKAELIASIYNNKTPFKRWGKEKDKKAFKMLQTICQENDYNIDKFIMINEDKIINKESLEFTNEIYSSIVEGISTKFNWMRKPIHLFYRFKKIYSQQNKLSVREVRSLKKILIESIGRTISDEEIMFHFPGKTKSIIQKTARDIMSSL